MKLLIAFVVVLFGQIASANQNTVEIRYNSQTDEYLLSDCGPFVEEFISRECLPILAGTTVGARDLPQSIKSKLESYSNSPATLGKKKKIVVFGGGALLVAGVCVLSVGGCVWLPVLGIIAGEGVVSGLVVTAFDIFAVWGARKAYKLDAEVSTIEQGFHRILGVMSSMKERNANTAWLEVDSSVVTLLKELAFQRNLELSRSTDLNRR